MVLFADQPVEPGSEAFVQLVLERTIAAAVGDRFILRDPSGQRTIGGGRFLDLRAPARKRRTPERLDQLAACALEDPAESLATLLVRAPYFVDFSAFARDRALADGERRTARSRTRSCSDRRTRRRHSRFGIDVEAAG